MKLRADFFMTTVKADMLSKARRLSHLNVRHLGVLAVAVVLAGCQSTPDVVNPTTFQGTPIDQRVRDKSEVAKARTQLAAQYIRERQLDAAKRQLETALEADPRYAPAYDMMGVLLQTEGSPSNLAKADEFFRRSLSLDSQSMQTRNNYGVYLSQTGREHEAVAQFKIAGAALGYEGRTRALENLGLSYLKIGNTAEAKEAFIRAVEANTGSAIARVELINIFLAEGNSLIAKRLYDELVVMAGTRTLPAEVMLQGVKIAIMQGNRTQQQQLAQKLLSTHPLSDEARRLKTWLSNPSQPLK
ncbi:MAG: type IV pilus biogenesis/stability protein PilW [Moraxella sp.]|nr:type IV pilus biogenesis/stability protein PilW [Moraxella sp.]